MPKFIENFKRFTFAVLTLYVVTVPLSSSAAAVGEDPLFQKGINILTVLTTLLILACVFFQWRQDQINNQQTLKTEPYLVIAAVMYFVICLGSAVFAEKHLDHCLSRVFTLFCFLNNAFWPHIIFAKDKYLKFLNGAIIAASICLAGIYCSIALVNNFSFNRYDYNDMGKAFGLPAEWGLNFDPNIMLFGFMYGLITIFSFYSSEKLPSFVPLRMGVFGIGFLMLALLGLMFSRTTAIALGLTILFYFIRRYFHDYRFWVVIAVLVFFLIVSAPEISEFVGKSEIYTNLTEGREISNDDRLFRLESAVSIWLSDLKNILIGRGYGIEIILDVDPHNIYLTHLHSSGIVGFGAFATFIFAMKYYGKNLTSRENAVLDMSYLYIAIGAATYWHNKSMWVIFLLCLMRTQVYRTQHELSSIYDFEENPVNQFGMRVTTMLTGLFSPNKNRQRRAKIEMKQRARKKKFQQQNQPKIARKPDVSAETKTVSTDPNSEYDFQESTPSRLKTGLDRLVSGLWDRKKVPGTNKKLQQMARKNNKDTD
jgi:MFS family permease